MKKTLIPIAALGAVAGFALRRLQLSKSYDAAGLIARGDKLSLALYLICALFGAALLVLCLRQQPGVQSPAGKSRLRGLLVILAGLALLGSYLPPSLEGGMKMAVPVLAFAASCAMVIEGLYHMNGAIGSLLGGCILPVYLAASLIGNYRTWSHDPIVADFCFPLLFLVAAMLASYHLAAFRVGRGKRRTAAFLAAFALVCAGAVLADGGWRSILRTVAVSVYLIAELWPYLAKPDPLPEPEKTEAPAEETAEAAEEAAPAEEAAEPIEEAAPAEEAAEPIEAAAPAEEAAEPIEEAAPAEEAAEPIEEAAPMEEAAEPTEAAAPAEETAEPIEEAAPAEETVEPIEEAAPELPEE